MPGLAILPVQYSSLESIHGAHFAVCWWSWIHWWWHGRAVVWMERSWRSFYIRCYRWTSVIPFGELVGVGGERFWDVDRKDTGPSSLPAFLWRTIIGVVRRKNRSCYTTSPGRAAREAECLTNRLIWSWDSCTMTSDLTASDSQIRIAEDVSCNDVE